MVKNMAQSSNLVTKLPRDGIIIPYSYLKEFLNVCEGFDVKEIYQKMGIEILGKIDWSGVFQIGRFYKVMLPEGWKIEYIDHLSNSYEYELQLTDEKNRVRGTITSKCESDAVIPFIELRTKYYFKIVSEADLEGERTLYGIIFDCDKEIFRFKGNKMGNKKNYGITESAKEFKFLSEKCRRYLDKKFPNWLDITAYWDE